VTAGVALAYRTDPSAPGRGAAERIARTHIASPVVMIERVASDEAAFKDVLALRAAGYAIAPGRCRDETDDYSDVVVAYVEGRPAGTLRITHAMRGRLDCEEHFPAALVERHRPRLGSASRFCVGRHGVGLPIARMLIEAGWRLALDQGTRLDIIDVHARATRYYRRLGYHLLHWPGFTHPLLGTPSRVMAFTTEPDRATPLAHLLAGLEDHVRVQEIREWL
jgi:hypothetical protein